jgi:hypothetical protein
MTIPDRLRIPKLTLVRRPRVSRACSGRSVIAVESHDVHRIVPTHARQVMAVIVLMELVGAFRRRSPRIPTLDELGGTRVPCRSPALSPARNSVLRAPTTTQPFQPVRPLLIRSNVANLRARFYGSLHVVDAVVTRLTCLATMASAGRKSSVPVRPCLCRSETDCRPDEFRHRRQRRSSRACRARQSGCCAHNARHGVCRRLLRVVGQSTARRQILGGPRLDEQAFGPIDQENSFPVKRSRPFQKRHTGHQSPS